MGKIGVQLYGSLCIDYIMQFSLLSIFFLGNDGTFCFARYYYWVNCQSLRVSKALKIIWCWVKDKERYSTSSSSSTFIFLPDVGPRHRQKGFPNFFLSFFLMMFAVGRDQHVSNRTLIYSLIPTLELYILIFHRLCSFLAYSSLSLNFSTLDGLRACLWFCTIWKFKFDFRNDVILAYCKLS